MASSAGIPNNPSPNFDVQKLFKPPNPNPQNPNPNFYSPPPPQGPFSFPPPTPTFQHHPFPHYPQSPFPTNPNPNHGARLMALLGTNHHPTHLESSSSLPPSAPPAITSSDFPPILHPTPSAPPATTVPKVANSKMPRGRLIVSGERAVYDVDSRLMGGSAPPQLEVTPITKYVSDPGLVLGRQIAVNRTYISYGLKQGAIRILNINTALRSLLRGFTQKVTDMAFFAEDVHLFASASVDGKVYAWKIDEGPDEENKPQITGKIVVAIQIGVEGDLYHPRICWHSHKQEVLVVAIGNHVLKIDTTKVGRGKEFSENEPLKCPFEKLIDGVQLIGKHDGDVTDLSISQWMTTRLASASKDGTVKIWDDRKAVPLATLRPHEGQPVCSVAFLTSPYRPDHIVLITAGPLNRELKMWTSTSEEGWLLPSDSETWQCTQILELRSSESRHEEAFFNQVVVLPRASLILLANAKKNAIYAVHVDYGPYPASTLMDYIAEFTVTMPILSLTGTSDCLPDGEQVVQVYCVQTHAIQQYAVDLYQCLPPQVDALLGSATSTEGFSVLDPPRGPTAGSYTLSGTSPESFFTGIGSDDVPTTVFHVPLSDVSGIHERVTSNVDVRPSAPPLSSDVATGNAATSPTPLHVDISSGLPISRHPSKGFEQGPATCDRDTSQLVDSPPDGRVDSVSTTVPDVPKMIDNSEKDETKTGIHDFVPSSHLMFNLVGKATHLVTPSEILSGALSSSENTNVSQGLKGDEVRIQEVIDNSDSRSMHVDESRLGRPGQSNSQKEATIVCADIDKYINPLASEVNNDMPKEVSSPATEICSVDDASRGDDIHTLDTLDSLPITGEEEVMNNTRELNEKATDSGSPVSQSASGLKGGKRKGKQSQELVSSLPALNVFNSTDPLNKPGSSMALHSTDAAFSKLQSMQDMLNQLVSMQKEMQKQMNSVVAGPVNKEGKRVETALGQSMEKAVKTNADALWVRFQDENAKRDKAERERMQQLTSLITNCMSKDLPAILEKTLKKEISSAVPVLTRAVTPIIEKSISSAVTDSFQRGVGDKAVGQLEKSVCSKLEATVARQIQAQFQTSGKQALQEALRSSLESSVVPVFEQSCKAMFEQVDAVFQKGMNEHTAAAQQQFESTHTPLAITLRDAINSASSITQNLTSELVDGQRKILSFVKGNAKALNPIGMQQNNGPMGGLPEMALSLQQIEAPMDPTKELSRLISERKFGDAFTMALQRSDVSIVSWLCSQVDLHGICSMTPPPLSQGVLLALLQQLACDISKETARKLGWMTDVAVAINPTDSVIAMHVRPIFEQVYGILAHQRSLPTTTGAESTNIRLIMHVINSLLASCK